MTLAIPSQKATWWPRFIPRPLYWSIHGFDWSPLLEDKRPGYDASKHVRVFGLGFDRRSSEAFGLYSWSVGARWLLNVAWGRKEATAADLRQMAGGLAPPSVWEKNRYVEISLFCFQFAWGRDGEGPWRLRYFFNGRRVFYKRRNNADRQG